MVVGGSAGTGTPAPREPELRTCGSRDAPGAGERGPPGLQVTSAAPWSLRGARAGAGAYLCEPGAGGRLVLQPPSGRMGWIVVGKVSGAANSRRAPGSEVLSLPRAVSEGYSPRCRAALGVLPPRPACVSPAAISFRADSGAGPCRCISLGCNLHPLTCSTGSLPYLVIYVLLPSFYFNDCSQG